jgi:hypothetical protein
MKHLIQKYKERHYFFFLKIKKKKTDLLKINI